MLVNEQQKVIATEHRTRCGQRFGQLTLNKPKALNALDVDMATTMLAVLKQWEQADDMVFVLIDSVGDKAFCAGGDIVSMYHAMAEQPDTVPPFIKSFFTVEYELDHTIHTFSKPVVVWGSGIVMGGGMGLLQGASHRVVTETSKLAMPEISIGLFPDVGASFFLPRLHHKLGLFLGMTAAQLNGAESVNYGMADFLCNSGGLNALISQWQDTDWSSTASPGSALSRLLQDHSATIAPDDGIALNDRVAPWLAEIERICAASTASVVKAGLLAIDAGEDPWLRRAQQSLSAGSSLTAALFFSQFSKGAQLSLSDCFRMELIMACRCAEFGELKEGIRALLIDKDGNPAWRFNHIDAIPDDVVAGFFAPPWEEAHPLVHLGES
ncbi:enoyl-CoA hydratase/isomerase family protein [Alteromonas confluentis]|uniref:3-hydroxyisobutyryl-CoA hydrolase n=1 Tax=Alteromonas confluentis TaxID=1656094 RepID=A0A1E7ZE03_9ALTE|nr:enoyl-CoA hydratase [Alteromonas confluentis]